jgi:hypothetical protein
MHLRLFDRNVAIKNIISFPASKTSQAQRLKAAALSVLTPFEQIQLAISVYRGPEPVWSSKKK